jgi:hypothetical protein
MFKIDAFYALHRKSSLERAARLLAKTTRLLLKLRTYSFGLLMLKENGTLCG